HIRATASARIEQLKPRGGCNFVTDYAETLPIEIITGLMQLPTEDAMRLRPIARQMQLPDGTMTFAEALQHFRDYIGPIIDARLGGDGTDMISIIINQKVDGRTLTKGEATEVCANITIAGLDTVVNMLSFIMQFLARNPDQRRELVANPGMIPDAIDE